MITSMICGLGCIFFGICIVYPKLFHKFLKFRNFFTLFEWEVVELADDKSARVYAILVFCMFFILLLGSIAIMMELL